MATETEQLVVSLEARIRDFERNFQKASRTADRNWSQIERRGEQAASRVEKTFGGMSSRLSAGFASFGDGFKGAFLGSLGVLGVSQIIDKLGSSIERLNEIGEIAGRTGFTTDMVQAFQELGREATASVENVDKALQAFTEQSATTGSFLQKLFKENGKDFDLANPIRNLKTFMDLVRNAGSDAEKLAIVTQVVGDRSGRELTEAFKRGGNAVDEAFNKMTRDGKLMSQAQIDEAARIKSAYIDLAADLEAIFGKLAVGIGRPIMDALNRMAEQNSQIVKDMRGHDWFHALFGRAEDWDLNPFDNATESMKKLSAAYKEAIAPVPSAKPAAGNPITKLPPASSGSGSKRKEVSDLEREIAALKLRSDALNQDAMILTGLIGKENDHGFALEKARATRDLLNAAEKSGVKVTDELKAKVDQLAGAYAASVANVDAAKAAQDAFADKQADAKAKMEDFKAGAQNVLGGFISDIRTGITETEALSNALSNIADQLLQIAMNKIFQSPAADGVIGGIIGGLGFASGGFTGNAGRNAVAGVVHGQEFVVNAAATAQNRALLEAINSGAKLPSIMPSPGSKASMAGGSQIITMAPTINVSVGPGARGDKMADAELAANIGKVVNASMRQIVAQELRQQMRPGGMLRT